MFRDRWPRRVFSSLTSSRVKGATALLAQRAVAASLAVAAVAVALWAQFQYSDGSAPGRTWYGFALAVVLLAVSTVLAIRRSRGADVEPRETLLPHRLELVLALAVFGLAAFFRFYRFLGFPPGVWYDEGVNALDAIYIIDIDHFTVWRDTNYGKATLYLYLVAGSFKTFGYTVFAMRLVPALCGLATVVAFYVIARKLTGPLPALAAAALLAAGRWATTFSRINWDAAIMPLFSILAVYALIQAMETGKRYWFVLAGGSLAAGLYTYVPFRVMPAVLAFMLLYAAATRWPIIRRNAAGLVVYAASFLIVIYPLAQFSLTHWDAVMERTRAVNVSKEIDERESYEPLRSNVRASVKMMNVAGDTNGRHNIPGEPMLDEITAALFVLGFAVSLWSYRDWRKGSLGVWYVAALIPGVLTITQENPSAIRGVGAIPPIYLMAALALETIGRPFTAARRGVYAYGGLLVLIVAAAVAINYYDFFERQYGDQRVYDSYFPAFREVGELVAKEGDDRLVYVSRDFSGEPALPFLGRGTDYRSYTPATNVVVPDTGRSVTLVLDDRQHAVIPTLKRLYPHLTQADVFDPWNRPLYTRVDIPSEGVAAAHRLNLVVSRNGTQLEEGKARLDRDWSDDDLREGPLEVTWTGYLWTTTAAGDRSITISAPGSVSVEIDGEALPGAGDSLSAARRFSPGEHRVSVRARIERPGRVEFSLAPGEPELTGADLLYAESVGDRGFRVLYRDGSDFASEPVAAGRLPFAVPSDRFGSAQAIEYQGLFTVDSAGEYGLRLDSGVSSQVYVDGVLVVDASGGHAAATFEGNAVLEAGDHVLSIQYTLTDRPTWALYMSRPGSDYALMDGSEFSAPPDDYRPPGFAQFVPDPAWGGANGRRFEELGDARALAVTADGTLVAASEDRLAFVSADGTVQRIVQVQADEIVDIAVTPSGHIGVLDGASRSLLILGPDGALQRSVEGAFPSAGGLGVFRERFVVASPAGGGLYAVSPETGDVQPLPMSNPETEGHPAQPSDVTDGPDGALYVNDFERKTIIVSADGTSIDRTFAGLSGTGAIIPRLTAGPVLLFGTEPFSQRLVAYDATGRQRGMLLFPGRQPVTPFGAAAGPGGVLYVAAFESGVIYRYTVQVPDDLVEPAR